MSAATPKAPLSGTPATVATMRRDLAALGVQPGMNLLVHTALSRLGWVCGGAQAVIMALEAAIGSEGTLMMPTHTTDLSEPSFWQNPPVPQDWWPIIRAEMPAFDPDLTPCPEMGIVADTFRKQSGVLRSAHPQVSFAARGPNASYLTAGHRLEACLGEGSPLARLYELGGYVLLLGVGHGNNTSIHLAEYRADFTGKRTIRTGAPIMIGDERRWIVFVDLDWDDDDFPAVGNDFAADTGLLRRGAVRLRCGPTYAATRVGGLRRSMDGAVSGS